ncbi:HYR domain-containing protein, partial [Oceanihabitans sp.]|nr:HYR domain-containing protein [Oceanihabitans sp.]
MKKRFLSESFLNDVITKNFKPIHGALFKGLCVSFLLIFSSGLFAQTITCPSNITVDAEAGLCGAIVNYEVTATPGEGGPSIIPLEDFEGPTFPGLGAGNGAPLPTIIPDPTPGATNGTNVLSVITNAAGAPWQQAELTLQSGFELDLTGTDKRVSVDWYSATPFDALLKVEVGGPASATEAAHPGGGWQTLVFDFNNAEDCIGVANGVYQRVFFFNLWDIDAPRGCSPDGDGWFIGNGNPGGSIASTTYVDNISKGVASSNSLIFSESFIQNQQSPHCGTWQSFRASLLDNLPYTKVTIKGSLDPIGVSVTDPAKVLQLANGLRTGTPVSLSDGGLNWIIGTCGGGIEITATGSLCDCRSGYTVRPCINPGNPNWGGAGTATCGGPSQTLTIEFEIEEPVTIVSTPPSGSVFNVGTTTVTSIATDGSGSTATCSFDVTVVDNEVLSIDCNVAGPQNALTNNSFENNDGHNSQGATDWTQFGPVFLTDQNVPGTATAQDGDFFVKMFSGNAGLFQELPLTAGDNITGSVYMLNASNDPTGPVGGGQIKLEWIGAAGVATSDTFTNANPQDVWTKISVNAVAPAGATGVRFVVICNLPAGGAIMYDNASLINNSIPPSGLVGDVSVNNDPGACGANLELATPATTSCQVTITNDYTGTSNASGFYPIGVTPVTWTVTNSQGLTASCSVNITVVDNETPTLDCSQGANSGNVLVNNSFEDGAVFNVPFNTDWTTFGVAPLFAIDANIIPFAQDGNFYLKAFSSNAGLFQEHPVTAGDIIDASIYIGNLGFDPIQPGCEAYIKLEYNNGDVVESIRLDNSLPVNTWNQISFSDVAPAGATSVKYVAVMGCPGGGAVMFDNASMIITGAGLVGNVEVDNDPGACGAQLSLAVPSNGDNCGAILTNDFNGTGDASDFYPVGTTTVTWTITDAQNLSTSCTIDVTVTDNENPTISCVGNQTKDTNPDNCTYTVVGDEFDPTNFTDNCLGSTIENDYNNSTSLDGAVFDKGTTTVTWTVTDNGGPLPNVGVLSSTGGVPNAESDVLSKLTTTGAFNSVSSINVAISTPTLADLQQYDAVLVWNDDPFANDVALGNVLAAYVDAGGGVVVSMFTQWSPSDFDLQGDFRNNGYLPLDGTSSPFAAAGPYTMNIINGSHPIMKGVTTFNGGSSSFRGTNLSVQSGATLLADWSTGDPLIAYKEPTNGKTVSLNFFPPSSDSRSDFWDVNTDGALIMANSLAWAAGTRNTVTCSFDVTINDNEVPTIDCDVAGPQNALANNSLEINNGHNTQGVANWNQFGPVFMLDQNLIGTAQDGDFFAKIFGPNAGLFQDFPVTAGDNITGTVYMQNASFDQTNPNGGGQVKLEWLGTPEVATSDLFTSVNPLDVWTEVSVNAVAPAGATGVRFVIICQQPAGGAIMFDNASLINNSQPGAGLVGDVSVNNDPGACGAELALATPATADNCEVVSITNDYNGTVNASGFYPVGTTTVVWTVEDTAGFTATCSVDITVTDNEAPTIDCSQSLSSGNVLDNNSFENGAVFNVPFNTDWNTFGPPIFSIDANIIGPGLDGDFYLKAFGDNTGLFQDHPVNAGDEVEASIYIGNLAFDQMQPGCEAYIKLEYNNGDVVESTRIDNSLPINTWTQLSFNDIAPAGATSVRYVAVMGCPQVGAINGSVMFDNASMTITSPNAALVGDVEVDNDLGACGAQLSLAVPIAGDNCPGVTITNDYNNTGNASDFYPVGTTTVTWTVTDAQNLSTSCTIDVTVYDTEAPVVMCDEIEVTLDGITGEVDVPASDLDNNSTDNCQIASYTVTDMNGDPIDVATFTCADTGGDLNQLLISEYTDGEGDNDCIELYNGTGASVDLTDYSIAVYLDDSTTPTLWPLTGDVADRDVFVICHNFAATTASDLRNGLAFDGNDAVALQYQGNDVDLIGIIGDNPATGWTEGSNTTANTSLVRNDDVLAGNISNTNSGLASEWTSYPATNTSGLGSHDIEITGLSNNVILTVTDIYGNSSTCEASVTVVDDTPPIAIAQDVTVELDALGNGSTSGTQVNNGSSDICGIASLVLDQNDFTCANVGVPNPVILTVTDNNGNVSTATANVTVIDGVAPNAITQDAVVVLDANGNGSVTAAEVDNGSSDACGIDTITVSPSTFDCSNVGDNVVTLTVTDVNGNVSTATANVEVQDNTNPTAVCANITVTLDATGSATITPADVDGGSEDACGILNYEIDIDTFGCDDLGANDVVLTVTDNNGNSSSCTAVVTVEGDLPVVDITEAVLPGLCQGD